MLNLEYIRRPFVHQDLDLEDLVLTYVGSSVPALPGFSNSGYESGYSSLASTPDSEFAPFDWPSSVSNNTESLDVSNDLIDNSLCLPLRCVLSPIISQEPALGSTFAGQPITYKIDLGEAISTPNSKDSIKTYVIPPCGKPIQVSKEIDYLTNQLVCTFKSYENGIHTVMASSENNCISGSPFQVNVSRNYEKLDLEHQIVEVDMELMLGENVPDSHRFRKPWGIAVDKKRETIYASDREHHEILAYGPDGSHLFSFGSRGEEAGEFRRPTGIAFDPVHDRLYITDKDNHRVQVYSPTGTYLFAFGKIGKAPGDFLFPWGIAVSPNGNLIAVVDSRNHRIQLLTKEGKFLRKFYPRAKKGERGHAEQIGWYYPRGISFDNTGEYLYVTDFNGHGIFKLHVSFTHYDKFACGEGELKRPSGITVDEAGNVLVCDHRNDAIKIYSPFGNLIKTVTKIGDKPVELPTDLAVLNGGYLVILDCCGRIRII